MSRLRWIVGVPVLLGALDLTVVTAVLPAIVEELAIPLPGGFRLAAWLVTGYLTSYVVAVAVGGRFSDTFGVRRVFMGSAAVFVGGSILVAIATGSPTTLVLRIIFGLSGARPDPSVVSLWILIVARSIQALGAGAVVPAAMAAVSVDPGRRLRDLGFIAGIDMAGWMAGHLYGGLVVQVADWRMLFWINVPLAVGAALLAWRYLDPVPIGERGSAWHTIVGGSGVGLVALGISLDAALGWRLGLGGVGAVLLVAFGRTVVPVRLLRGDPRSLVGNVLVGLLIFFVLAAVPLYVGTLLEADTTRAALMTGLLLTAFTLPMAIAAPLGGRLAETRDRSTMLVAGVIGSVGLLAARGWGDTASSLILALVLSGAALGLFLAPLADRLVRRAPSALGRASSAVIVLRLAGMAMGTAILTDWVLRRVRGLSGSVEVIRAGIQGIFDEAFVIALAVFLVLVVVVGSRTDTTMTDSLSGVVE